MRDAEVATESVHKLTNIVLDLMYQRGRLQGAMEANGSQTELLNELKCLREEMKEMRKRQEGDIRKEVSEMKKQLPQLAQIQQQQQQRQRNEEPIKRVQRPPPSSNHSPEQMQEQQLSMDTETEDNEGKWKIAR